MYAKSLILVRHAESEHHVKRLSGGWTDTPITELGHQQAHRVAQRLKAELDGLPIRLYTSDFLRTRNTAEHIAGAIGVEPVADERLREFNNGEAANLTIDEALQRWPERPGPWPPDHRQWPGGETWRELYARAAAFLDSLEFDGGIPLVVTHGGTVQALVAMWLRLTPEAMTSISFATHVTALTVLEERDGVRRIERLNDIGHLEGIDGHVQLASLAG